MNKQLNFEDRVERKKLLFTNEELSTMQVNIGKVCNLACRHCHVEAGPNRNETMDLNTIKDCLQVFKENGFKVLDITGGAPEMNPNLEYLIEEGSKIADKIIVRTNMVILDDPKYSQYIDLYLKHKVELVGSMPCYLEENVNYQRGDGTYEVAIKMLKKLNEVGYGVEEGLVLNLVYNPGGGFLPPEQAGLEEDYRLRLREDWGIEFNNLFTITNVPIGRFKYDLKTVGELENYEADLYENYNPDAVANMMCRDQISVAYDGSLYDCDFNQAIGMGVNMVECKEGDCIEIEEKSLGRAITNISELRGVNIEKRRIETGNHCYACTAGAGSSCGGALV
ncbi:MAG: arsenosugar biosynthesis radical SAM protein ArsS [Clostridioides sp.]|jgi:radical SAM/Cys-rich protein|nr:arsenosugar biosynthesis radical SAM protein ArsS [Clostridioides sp.]